jgi:filamentous hemagglutinin
MFSNLRPGDVVVLQNTLRFLSQDAAGRYWLKSVNGVKITPSGLYDFVTMPDGIIRLARQNRNFDYSTHLGLSGGADVAYAGSIRFANNMGPKRGAIVHWRNDSGHYQPPATMACYAGLPLGLFLAY